MSGRRKKVHRESRNSKAVRGDPARDVEAVKLTAAIERVTNHRFLQNLSGGSLRYLMRAAANLSAGCSFYIPVRREQRTAKDGKMERLLDELVERMTTMELKLKERR